MISPRHFIRRWFGGDDAELFESRTSRSRHVLDYLRHPWKLWNKINRLEHDISNAQRNLSQSKDEVKRLREIIDVHTRWMPFSGFQAERRDEALLKLSIEYHSKLRRR